MPDFTIPPNTICDACDDRHATKRDMATGDAVCFPCWRQRRGGPAATSSDPTPIKEKTMQGTDIRREISSTPSAREGDRVEVVKPSTKIRWAEPPPVNRGTATSADVNAFVEELKTSPGKFAIWRDDAKSNIKLKRPGTVSTCRMNADKKTYTCYVKWVG